MSEAGGDNIKQRIGTAVGIMAALLILRRLRKRRKEKKLQKAKAKARAHLLEQRIKEEKARGKKAGKKEGKGGKKGKKDRSILEQIVRFTILAVAKKMISQQIELAGKELGGSKLGKKVVAASGA
jgi:hypothetical protein